MYSHQSTINADLQHPLIRSSSSYSNQMERPRSRQLGRGKAAVAGNRKADPLALFSPNTISMLQTPDKPLKDIIKGRKYQIEKVLKAGKHGQVALGSGQVTPGTDSFACKTQTVRTPGNQNSRAYRELLIFKQLNRLRRRPDIYPNNNFVGFIRLLDGFQGYSTPTKGSNLLVNLILEKADCTLHDKRLLPLFEMRSILFQLLFALTVSQREFGFVHKDLHLQNVLLKEAKKNTTGTVGRYRMGEQEWYTNGKWIVKISDFGLSRMTINNVDIADESSPFGSVFSETEDTEALGRSLNKIKIDRTKVHKQELLHQEPNTDLSALVFDEEGYLTVPDDAGTDATLLRAQEFIETNIKLISDIKRRMARAQPPLSLLKYSAFNILKTDPRPPPASSKKPRAPVGSTSHVVGGTSSSVPLDTVSPMPHIATKRFSRPEPTSPFAAQSKNAWRPKQTRAPGPDTAVMKLQSLFDATKENQPENDALTQQPQATRIADRRPKRAATRAAAPPSQAAKPKSAQRKSSTRIISSRKL